MEQEEKKTRRPYHKPQLEQVQLVAEEAVLQFCKTTVSGGPQLTPCFSPGDKCKNKGT